jgi:hypothetical protein
MTTTATDVETIEHLDFEAEVPCEVQADDRDDFCGRTAHWLARLRCAACHLIDVMPLCVTHRDRLLDADFMVIGTCDGCGFTGAPMLDSIEPIR